jgi:hypothetical protein
MTHIAKLKLLPRTTMKAKGATRLVGQVTGGDGITVTKTAGNFEVTLDLDGFDVVQGPVGSTDNAVARWDGLTGRLLQDSLVSIADDGEMTVPALAGVTDIDATTRATLFEPYIYQIQAIDDDGASDQSAAIQAQIDYCEANGICEAVFPPYKIRCWPIVSHPIKLRGTGVRIAMGVLAEGQPSDVGTRLYRTAADTAQYGIDILSGANGVTIEGICFLEEHAADGPGWTPTVYKAAIRNKAPWTTIRKNVFWGTYDGVQLGDGTDFNEPGSGYVTIEDNAFACFRAGVHAYKCGDWNIAVGNWFQGYFVEDNTYQREYIRANAATFYLGRTDSFEIFGGGAFYWQYGILTYINPDAPSAAEGISERLKVVGFDMDKVHVGYYLVARVTGEAIGCAIISDNAVVDPNTLVATTGSYGAQGNANVLFSFIGCRFHNQGIQAVIAADTNCTIKLIGCLIRDAGLDGGVAALTAASGATIERSLCTFIGSAAIESGAGTFVTTSTLAGAETLSNKMLTAPKFASGGFIADANGNEQIIFVTTASAVNEITHTNAATGNNPKFAATGGDTNIGIDYQVKGTARHRFLATTAVSVDIGSPVNTAGTLNIKQNADAFTNALRIERNTSDSVLAFGYRSSSFAFSSTFASTGGYLPLEFLTNDAVRLTIQTDAGGGKAVFTVPITATSYNGLTVTTSTGTLTIANGSTLVTSGANSLTLTTVGTTNAKHPPITGDASLMIAKSAVQVSHTGNTNETVLATIAIPANALGPNGRIEIWPTFGNNNSGNSKTYRVRFGASGAGTGGTQIWTTSNTTNTVHNALMGIANRNATNSQLAVVSPASATGLSGGTLGTAAIDTTAATEIVLTGQLANSGDNVTIEGYRVQVTYGA